MFVPSGAVDPVIMTLDPVIEVWSTVALPPDTMVFERTELTMTVTVAVEVPRSASVTWTQYLVTDVSAAVV